MATSDYTAEIRFGVVMYGGVSLAIYINGVANEFFEMACATPREGFDLDPPERPGTREVYRRLSWLANCAELRERYAAALARVPEGTPPERADVWLQLDLAESSQTRLVIDVVAGTSAGGINGMFLAKALANGEQFGALKELWVNEGDIGLLLNDKRSYQGTLLPLRDRSAQPSSLLNGDRMYAKLLAAMQAMQPLRIAEAPPAAGSPLAEEVDLFVTTTDIRGSIVPLRLFDKVVHERRYKQHYHFSYAGGTPLSASNDFAAVNNPFLAFAARCTSSFPFAFEPMTLDTVERLGLAGAAPGLQRWKRFFKGLPREEVDQGAHRWRAFGDGGYLDNKPFGYVVEALSQRFSSVPVERKLVFVEPSPEQLDPQDLPSADEQPDALENALAAVTSIPRYETTREDLQAVLQRNRRIERVERMVRLGERDIAQQQSSPFANVRLVDGQVPRWSRLKLSEMAAYYGLAFLPYQRLRVYAVTDRLADQLGQRWDIDRDSDLQYALRALVRVWRERGYHDEGKDGRATVNAFLDEFDFDYRLRRLGHLLRKIDQLTRLLHKRLAGPLDSSAGTAERPATLAEAERELLAQLPEPYRGLGAALTPDSLQLGLRVLAQLKRVMLQARSAAQAWSSADRQAPEEEIALERARLHDDLQEVLLLVLGQMPSEQQPRIRAASGVLNIVLDPAALKLASVSRTLQEGVTFRAAALFAAADTQQETPLQQALLRDLESLRVKRGERAQAAELPPPSIEPVFGRVWRVLGCPGLVPDADGKAVLQVNAAEGVDSIDATALADLNSAEGLALRRFFSEAYLRFDSFDQMSFPLYYDTGTGEPSTVEVVRISPADATNLINEATDPRHRRKLAGTALANFGAFLDRRWRLNDIMWGRLDGAERLIHAVLPMADPVTLTVRHALIEQAQQCILREALVPEGEGELTDLLLQALAELPADSGSAAASSTGERLRSLLDMLWSGNRDARERLASVLTGLLDERGLMQFVRERREVDPNPEPEATLKNAARAVTITGRVLEGISGRRGGHGGPATRWLARLGLLLQGVVAISLPGSLRQRWSSHIIKLLYAFELVALLVALLFGSADMRQLAFLAFGATLGVHLLSLVLGDLMRERGSWLRLVGAAAALVLLLLGGVGLLVLLHQGAQQQLCWQQPAPAATEDAGRAARLCSWLGRLHGPAQRSP